MWPSWGGRQACYDQCMFNCERIREGVSELSEPAHPWHGIAYAVEDDRMIGKSLQSSADEARKMALASCREMFPTNRCISVATLTEGCIAIAGRDKEVFYVRPATRRKDAEAAAIQSCNSKDGRGQCQIQAGYCVYGHWNPDAPDTLIGEMTAQFRQLREILAPTPSPQSVPPKLTPPVNPTDYHGVWMARVNGSGTPSQLQWAAASTKAGAEAAAMNACQKKGSLCTLLSLYQGMDCAAVAIDQNGLMHVDTGPTLERGRKYTLQKCVNAGSGNCSLFGDTYCPGK